jgi:hypothetical protein
MANDTPALTAEEDQWRRIHVPTLHEQWAVLPEDGVAGYEADLREGAGRMGRDED